jgi:hypothetical protein
MRLEAYIDLKGKSRLWGDGKAQAYAKRLYMMRLIRRSAPYVARDLPRPLTQDEKEERAAVQLDEYRTTAGETMPNYYDSCKAKDLSRKKRKKKNHQAEKPG